ncbi:MAG: response regulator, partial [Desulfovibrionaceae bacterium]|nr:response regulator [Desulfovibrionaceae bacterium]
MHNFKSKFDQLFPSFLSLLFLIFFTPKILYASQALPYDLRGNSLPFLPYLEYMLDENGSLDIETVSLQEKSLQFLPLKPLDLELNTGTFWLRFTLGPLPEGEKPQEWLLSLGSSFPGDPQLYVPEIQSLTGMQQWKVQNITDRHILKLPDPGAEPKTCYIRLAGPPGLWFAPMLRSPASAANNWGPLAKPAVIIALGVILVLALLRCFTRNSRWRFWEVLFTGGALAAGYLGLPTVENGHIGYSQVARALIPGLTLMLLPHVARHLMRTPSFSRIVDAQLILLTLVGAVLTLLPLAPGFSWTARFLELWPLGTTLFMLTALWALFLGLSGSVFFLIACFLPPLCTAASIFGLLSGLPAELLAALPLAGIALSAFFLVLAPNPPAPQTEKSESDLELTGSLPETNQLKSQDQPLSLNKDTEELSLVDDSDLKVKPDPEPKLKGAYATPLFYDAIRIIYLQTKSLSQNAKQTPVEASSLELWSKVKDLYASLDPKNKDQGLADPLISLNLKYLMAELYERLQPLAQQKKVSLAWYLPPNLPQFFKAPASLSRLLKLLVENAVNATSQGLVEYEVMAPKLTKDSAKLLFRVNDTGEARPSAALLNAYDLAANLQGRLDFHTGPKGTKITLELELEILKA